MFRTFIGAAVILALAALTGCGGSATSAFVPIEGTESAYCDTLRAWQVHELDGGEGDDQPTPAALEAYWQDYLEFNATMLEQSPPEVRDDWEVTVRAVRTTVTPVLEKYDFDGERIAKEGTPAEQSVIEPTGDAKKAQDAIHAYEDRVCGLGATPAADVDFTASEASEAYCQTLGTFYGELAKIEASKFDPEVLEEFVTSDRFKEQLDALDEAAPEEIAADQEALGEWWRGRWSDAIADLDYDIRNVWVDGTPEDRAVFYFSHPDVVEAESRVTAYEEQVCEA